MKKELGGLFFIGVLILSSCIFIRADIFGINWGSSEGEINVGGITPGLEPPSAEAEEGGGGGGGGTITPSVEEGFTVSPTLIATKVTKGQASQEKLTITNTGKTSLTINISVESLGKYVFPEETSFTISSGEIKNIILNIYVPESEDINFSQGKINVQHKDTIKSADIVLDIREKSALFDLKTTLLKKILFQGQKAFADITVLNLGDLKNIDVSLEMSLIDENKTVYDIKKEMFAINDSYEGEFFLTIPKDIDLGNYVFHSKVSYQNVTAESYDTFEVIKLFINFALIIFYLSIAILLTLITLVSIVLRNKLRT
ncbi:hypothetical protein M0R72_09520 [Candidatus Pacearchaeota archaeon]|jgi:hypothetical protein|nr:hypothetical protein [Candidatus Pacearchaeota archaeon]